MSSLERELLAHASALRALARALVGAGAADDIVQETALRALRSPPLHPDGLRGYLATILRRLASTYRRGETRRRRGDWRAFQPENAPRPDQALERGEMLQRITSALAALPRPYREVILQRYFEDRAPVEIAAATGAPVATVKTRIRRGLALLRAALDGHGGADWRPALATAVGLRPGTAVGMTSKGVVIMGTSKKFAACAALAIAGAVALLTWSPWSVVSRLSERPRGSSRTASGVDAPAKSGEVDASSLALGSGARTAVQEMAREIAHVVQVRVLDVAGDPVPGVEVLHSVPSPKLAAASLTSTERRQLEFDSEAWLRRFGAVAKTDARGIASWPRQELQPFEYWQCVVGRGDLYGEVAIPGASPADEVHELQLQLERGFRVDVLDASMRPLVDVAVEAHYASAIDGKPACVSCGFTDGGGHVHVRHVQTWRDWQQMGGASAAVTMAAHFPGLHVSSEVDGVNLPSDPVRLILPAAGSIEVFARTVAGAPLAGEGFTIVADGAPGAEEWHAQTDARGLARFIPLAAGRSWRIWRESAPSEPPRLVVGPSAQDEAVSIEWTAGEASVVLALIQCNGAPVAATSMQVVADGLALRGQVMPTDQTGRLRLPLREQDLGHLLTGVTVRSVDTEHGALGLGGAWRGELVLAAGANDLGVLDLHPEPVALEVQFVAPDGEVPQALGFAVEAATGSAEAPWRVVRLGKRRDRVGHFTVFGETPVAPLRLAVDTDQQYLPVPPQPFTVGDRRLRVILQRGGSVRASIVVGGRTQAICLQPLLLPLDRPAGPPSQGRLVPGRDPRVPRHRDMLATDPLELAYGWSAVLPGRYRLEVHARGLPQALLVVPDIEVVAGANGVDPRLQHLAIPGLRPIQLVLPQATAEQAGAGVVAILDGDRAGDARLKVEGGRVLLASDRPVDILVRLQGFHDGIVRGIDGERSISLDAGVGVTLRLDGYRPIDGSALRLELEALDDPLGAEGVTIYSAARGVEVAAFPPAAVAGDMVDGAVRLVLPAPGSHRVRAWVQSPDRRASPLLVEPAELAIGEAGGEYVIRPAPR